MRKGILITAILLSAFTLIAIGYNNNEARQDKNQEIVHSDPMLKQAIPMNSDFLQQVNSSVIPNVQYNVDTRYIHKVSREDAMNARSIKDLFPAEVTENIESFSKTMVKLLDEGKENHAIGMDGQLTEAQSSLLKTVVNSSDIYAEALCKEKENGTTSRLTYFMTVVPETPAEYVGGHEALIDMITERSAEEAKKVHTDQLKPGRVNFTIMEDGLVKNAFLESSSGFENLDLVMMDLVNDFPGRWIPARNAAGDLIPQTLTLFFGTMGC